MSISDNKIMEHHIYDFFWIAIAVNLFLVLLTIYFNYRRVLTMKRVIEIRTINIPKYQDSKFIYSADYDNSNFGFFVAIQTITFSASIILIPFLITNELAKDPETSHIIFGLLITVAYFSALIFSRKFFISNELEKIKINNKDMSMSEIVEFKDLFKVTSSKALYQNDELIIKVSKSANGYKQRIETLLIESVFIGALTFGTFVQITSPESISSISFIENPEKSLHAEGCLETQLKHADKIKFYLKDLKNELKKNESITESLKVDTSKLQKVITYPSNNINYNGGYFSNWSNDRKLTILSFYYKDVSDEEKYRLLTGKFESKFELKSDCLPLDVEKSFLEDSISSLLKDSLDSYHKITRLSALSARLSLCNEIYEVFDDNENTTEKVRGLLIRINPNLISKYNSIMKSSWDEQEFIFLIAIGSIICSVFYISVLIKRYPIIISIEKLIAEINKAKMWNNREENLHNNKIETEMTYRAKMWDNREENLLNKKIETEMTQMPDYLKLEYDREIQKYTDKVQIQLAVCENFASKIETNIAIVSLFRSIGLGVFFIVLLISTLMIDFGISVFLLIIITYAIFIAEILNENSFIISLWRLFWKKPLNNINLFDFD